MPNMRPLKVVLALLITIATSTACVKGNASYTPPTPPNYKSDINNTMIDRDFNTTWKATIDYVSDTFFVLENIEKDSGIINISFSANTPADYIECGTLYSTVSNAGGTRNYTIPIAQNNAQYETAENGELYIFNRSSALEGKINLILKEVETGKTSIKVNTRYVFTRNITVQHLVPQYGTAVWVREPLPTPPLSFNSGSQGVDSKGTTCYPNYKLESMILDGIKSRMQPNP